MDPRRIRSESPNTSDHEADDDFVYVSSLTCTPTALVETHSPDLQRKLTLTSRALAEEEESHGRTKEQLKEAEELHAYQIERLEEQLKEAKKCIHQLKTRPYATVAHRGMYKTEQKQMSSDSVLKPTVTSRSRKNGR